MLVTDLLHSCANDRVAAAAVSSIGGSFASRMQCAADDEGLTVGAYTSRVVRAFSAGATERDWRDLMTVVRGQDHPVLAGLQAILDRRTSVMVSVKRPVPQGLADRSYTAAAA